MKDKIFQHPEPIKCFNCEEVLRRSKDAAGFEAYLKADDGDFSKAQSYWHDIVVCSNCGFRNKFPEKLRLISVGGSAITDDVSRMEFSGKDYFRHRIKQAITTAIVLVAMTVVADRAIRWFDEPTITIIRVIVFLTGMSIYAYLLAFKD